MYTHTYKLRVKYSDTDSMGYMHHANYVRYYENARWELLRSLGMSYKTIEDDGYMLPVSEMKFKFFKPSFYDHLLTIKTTLSQIKGARMQFNFKMFNQEDELVNEANLIVAFIHKDSRKPCSPPAFIMNTIYNSVLSTEVHKY